MIQPTYVSFEQAKLLLEKGFEFTINPLCCITKGGGLSIMNQGCAERNRCLVAPEQWVVVEWLRLVHGIQVFLDYIFYDGFRYGCKYVKSNGDYGEIWVEGIEDDIDGSNTPQEAYSAAFDYILNELI